MAERAQAEEELGKVRAQVRLEEVGEARLGAGALSSPDASWPLCRKLHGGDNGTTSPIFPRCISVYFSLPFKPADLLFPDGALVS